ncbi:MAG: hypothetical protein CMO20_01785 [Thermoplasmata archaeon]|nr:hypothetical protein [Thermoplasmata archaeon]
MGGNLPEGWPGDIMLEGRTFIHLPNNKSDKEINLAGPATKGERQVFHNQAMAGNRTRTVLLMAHEMTKGILAQDKTVRMLDSLSASGVRCHRLRNELPKEITQRLDITLCDLDPISIAWAQANHDHYSTNELAGFHPIVGDARKISLSKGWQWVDIDPFGSPIPFLDPVIQSLARRAVLEVTATDVAALTGSSRDPLMRRYGARARLDEIAHDTGLRILLANIARTAAQHDRIIEPILSVWDSHHLRVSVRVKRSAENANNIEDNLGWRIANPTEDEAGDYGAASHILVPLSTPISLDDKRVSGPLWIANIGDKEVMSSFTEESALSLCGPTEEQVSDQSELRLRRRSISRSVRHISDEAKAIHSGNLIVVDELASRLKLPSPPSPTKLAAALSEKKFSSSVAAYGKPAIRTVAPWDEIVSATLELI